MSQTKEAQRAELHEIICRIANDLRGSVDGWDFKSHFLGVLFYRSISENLTAYLNRPEREAGDPDFDYTKLVLEQLSNNTMRWMQVAIKPAKPYAFGYIGPTPVFGLPGNPVSSVVSFELFARPAILKMMGAKEIHRPVILARTRSPFHRNADGKLHLIRSNLICQPDGTLIVTPSGVQSSHVLSGLASANALALIPDGDGVSEGELVKTMLIGNLLASQLNLP
jgi:hypothetical protein